jgi:formate/nitrite transporter FocA (FNT family)
LAWDHALVGAISNLFADTLGNIIGGSVLVALVYWVIYLRRT